MSMDAEAGSGRGAGAAGLIGGAVMSGLVALTVGARVLAGSEDTDLYLRYAHLVGLGRVPYRDFLVEYPPVAIPFLVAPMLVARGVVGYKVAFAAEMLACNAIATLLIARHVARREGRRRVAARLTWMALPVLILGRLLVTRYDAAPMLVGFAASLAWAGGRPGRGGILAALGVGLKIYPGAAALVALAGDRGRPAGERGRGAVAFGLATAALGLTWLAVGGAGGVAASIRFQAGRGFEYGSLYSGAQMLAARLAGLPITVARDHSSFSTITRWSGSLLPWVFPAQAAAVLAVAATHARRGGRDGLRYQGAAVLAFIVAGKVFSPQFLIWLIPYMAVLEGSIARPARWLFLAVCALTLLAPGLLGFCPRTSLGPIFAYNGRNALILWLLVLLVAGPIAPEADPRGPRPGGTGPAG